MQTVALVVVVLVGGAVLLGVISARDRSRRAGALQRAAIRRGFRFDGADAAVDTASFASFLAPRRPGTIRHRVWNAPEDASVFEFDASSSEHGSYRFTCCVARLASAAPRSVISLHSRAARTRRRIDRPSLVELFEVDSDDAAFIAAIGHGPPLDWFVDLCDELGRSRPSVELLGDQLLVKCDPLDAERSLDLLERAITLRTLLDELDGDR